MCGITGIINENIEIHRMIDAIKHRGPDDYGFFTYENLSLGHRRLAIQDLSSNGHQPMFSTDDRYVLVFNGEIYNHLDIRKGLESKYTFKSSSDTETLLYAFMEYGTAVFNRLNGIFAFAVYDRHSGDLWLVRDQFGVKPLYYYNKAGSFLFGSEIKSFLPFTDLDKTLDDQSWVSYIQLLWSPGEGTPFQNVKKLEAGHYIRLNIKEPDNFQIVPYYEIPFKGAYDRRPEKQWIDLLEKQLLDAVERQLLSDVPVGAFLSGGLDSSLLVAMAREVTGGKSMQCFTIDAGMDARREGFTDDLPYAIKVADYLGVELEIVKGDIDIIKDFDKMIWHLDEPQADAAPLNVWNICKRARAMNMVVLLSGAGGDDLFSGYRRHQSLYYTNFLQWIPYPLRSWLVGIIQQCGTSVPFFRRLNKFLSLCRHKNLDDGMASLYGWLSTEETLQLFKPAIRGKVKGFQPEQILLNALKKIPEEKSNLNKMLFWDMKYFLADHNLNYTDKMSMAHGVEVRVPFLDKALVEFSTRIPPELKLKGKTTKYLLKKVGERYLPKDIVHRPKTGFGAPVREWMQHDLKPMIDQRLSTERLTEMGIFEPQAVRQLIANNASGTIDAAYPILALLAIESWVRQFKEI
jgi:asparagine synthase (glutamine-hydrolysing)